MPGLSYKDLNPLSEGIYTFVAKDGTNTNIASNRLFLWTEANKATLKIELAPVDPKLAQSFLHQNIASLDRCLELLAKPKITPIIFCHDGSYTDGRPDVLLVDGHHRYCLAGMLQLPVIPAYMLMVPQWEPFKILDLPSMSQDDLLNLPITPRSY